MEKFLRLFCFIVFISAILTGHYIVAVGILLLGISCAFIKKLLYLAVIVCLIYVLWAVGALTFLVSLF